MHEYIHLSYVAAIHEERRRRLRRRPARTRDDLDRLLGGDRVR